MLKMTKRKKNKINCRRRGQRNQMALKYLAFNMWKEFICLQYLCWDLRCGILTL